MDVSMSLSKSVEALFKKGSGKSQQQNIMMTIPRSTRRHDNVKVQSERQLRPTLSTMTRWDSERELGCDRPPRLKQRLCNGEEQQDNKTMLMVKAQSESHLLKKKRRWKPNGTAAGVDRPPTLKHLSSLGSSALFNASFPLRSRSGDMNVPLFALPSPSPSPLSSSSLTTKTTTTTPVQSSMRSVSSSSPMFPSSNYDLSMPGFCYKTKDDSFNTTTTTTTSSTATSPSSVMSWFDNVQTKQELEVSFLDISNNSSKNNNNIPTNAVVPPMRTFSHSTLPKKHLRTSLQRQASSSSCMTTFEFITSVIALRNDMESL